MSHETKARKVAEQVFETLLQHPDAVVSIIIETEDGPGTITLNLPLLAPILFDASAAVPIPDPAGP